MYNIYVGGEPHIAIPSCMYLDCALVYHFSSKPSRGKKVNAFTKSTMKLQSLNIHICNINSGIRTSSIVAAA